MASKKDRSKKTEQLNDQVMPPFPLYPINVFKWGINQRKLKAYWQEYFEALYDWQVQNNIPLPFWHEKKKDFASAMTALAIAFQKYHYDTAINGVLQLMIFEVLSYLTTFSAMLDTGEDYEIKETWPKRDYLESLLLARFKDHLDHLPVRPTRGGDKRSKRTLTNWTKRTFAFRVVTILPLWKHIISQLEKYEYENDVWAFIKGRPKFQSLCKDCYVDSDDPVLEQFAVEAVKKRKRFWAKRQSIPENFSAKAFAMYQAAQEVNIEDSYWVLEKLMGSVSVSQDIMTIKVGKNEEHGLYTMFIENPKYQPAISQEDEDPKAWRESVKKEQEQRHRRYLTATPAPKK